MPKVDYDVYLVAGADRNGEFPPTLNTATPVTELQPWESPDCYGLDLTVDGKVGKGTVPSGTARIATAAPGLTWVTGTAYPYGQLVTNSGTTYVCATAHTSGTFATDLTAGKWTAATYYWFYNRLWRLFATSNPYLWFGAPNYDDFAIEQGLGKIMLNQDAQAPVAICPFGLDNIAVGKATGSYIITNCSDTRGFFQRSDIIQELACSASTRMTELDGMLVVSNANGLVGYNGSDTKELLRPVRNQLTGLTNLALTVDYAKHRIIGGSVLVYEMDTGKIFKFSGSSFRFTTRAWHLPDYSVFAADRVEFVIEHGDTNDGYLYYQVKYEDGAWQDAERVDLYYGQEEYTVVNVPLIDRLNVRRIQFRITDIASNKYIKQIRIDAAAGTRGAYAQ